MEEVLNPEKQTCVEKDLKNNEKNQIKSAVFDQETARAVFVNQEWFCSSGDFWQSGDICGGHFQSGRVLGQWKESVSGL